MKRLLLGVSTAALLSGSVLAQSPPPRPSFDVAGIQVSTRTNTGMRGGVLRGNRYEIRNATMVDLIRTAYDVQPERISGGPAWLEWYRFDIAALAPEATPPARLREMLKTLLADRFKLAAREDSAAISGFALKVAGTHKLREAAGPGVCQVQGAPEPNGAPAQTVTCRGLPIARLVEQLPRVPGYISSGQQVIDETGLTGTYDFEFKITPFAALAQAGSDGITLQAALEKLGLKLESRELTVPGVVVDSVTKDFTPNAPDLAQRLPPLPAPKFEVATLRLSPPDAQQPRAQLLPTGQANISAAPLWRILMLAWTLPSQEFIVGPKFLETAKYDVVARAFVTANPDNQAQLDEDYARLMLRALLIERLQIKYHMEDRPMPAFAIKAENPKMTKANPATRTRCFDGPPPGTAATAKPQFGRVLTCQNVTMEQFGELLPNIAGGYTRVAAVDMSGLEGGYDFTLEFSPIEQLLGAQAPRDGGPTGVAVDPTGALSLQDAVRRQLGMRLDDTKRPAPVLVIDSMNETPADN